MTEPDRDILYPAKDREEALQRILESGWHITIKGTLIDTYPTWDVIIHGEDEVYNSMKRFLGHSINNEEEAVMDAYKKWRDEQLKGEEE